MSRFKFRYWLGCILFLISYPVVAQEIERPVGGIVDFRAPILPDPILQHSKETYILNGCAYCHGVDLKVRNGEAADLLHSALVGADINGNLIAPLLRNGIPQTAKLSPMPSFSDLSDHQLLEIARWIHYSRRHEHLKELMNAKSGDAAAGKTYVEKTCSSCHTQSNLTAIAKKYDATALKTRVLNPPFLDAVQSFKVQDLNDTRMNEARQKHGTLAENYTLQQAADLVAYMQALQ
jgi:cytochrome c551/c552